MDNSLNEDKQESSLCTYADDAPDHRKSYQFRGNKNSNFES